MENPDKTLYIISGANGSGKSTLLRTLAGLQPAISGEILISDKNISSLTNKQKAHLLSLVLTDNIEVENLYNDIKLLVEQSKNKVYKTVIPRNIKLSEAPSFGMPITLYDPKSKGARAYEKLTREILKNNEDRKEEE